MALLSFVESAPRAYRLKVGNADLFRNSTEPGTSPVNSLKAVVVKTDSGEEIYKTRIQKDSPPISPEE